MKGFIRLLSMMLTICLMVGLLAACGGEAASTGGDSPAAESAPPADAGSEAADDGDSAPEAAGGGSYLIAQNNWGQGVPALDQLEDEVRYVVTTYGADFQAYNDEFSADQMKSNIQGMISAGTDGIMFFGVVATLIPVVAEMCEEAQVPFVIFDQIPLDEGVIATLEENEYYVGSVGTDNYKAGYNLGEAALADGHQTAIILGGEVGDPVHDNRIAGFTESFEAGGGTVVGVGHCDSPASATTKCDDLIAASPDADCIYALTGDFATGALTAIDNHSVDMKVYASDSTSSTVESLKTGEVAVADGGSAIVSNLAAALLMNRLDGNPILTSEGKAPYMTDIVAFFLDENTADDYQTYWLSGHPLTEEQLSTLRGPDITIADFESFVADYSLENIVAGHK